MPGPGSKFSPKDDRQIAHIKASEVARGMPPKQAESVGYGTVVNQKKKPVPPDAAQAYYAKLRGKK